MITAQMLEELATLPPPAEYGGGGVGSLLESLGQDVDVARAREVADMVKASWAEVHSVPKEWSV